MKPHVSIGAAVLVTAAAILSGAAEAADNLPGQHCEYECVTDHRQIADASAEMRARQLESLWADYRRAECDAEGACGTPPSALAAEPQPSARVRTGALDARRTQHR